MGTTEWNFTVVNKTCHGKCSNCGECCSNFLPLDKFEIAKIKNYIKTHNIKPCRHVPNCSNLQDGICPFRDDEHKICTIYEARPWICRSFICSKSMPEIEEAKALEYSRKDAVSMWQIFFNEGPTYEQFVRSIVNQIKNKRGI